MIMQSFRPKSHLRKNSTHAPERTQSVALPLILLLGLLLVSLTFFAGCSSPRPAVQTDDCLIDDDELHTGHEPPDPQLDSAYTNVPWTGEGIHWQDLALERVVRSALNRPDGAIEPEEVAGIKGLHISGTNGQIGEPGFFYHEFNPDGDIEKLDDLVHFTGLQDLKLINNRIHDLTPLTELPQLSGLWLENNQISDLTPLANLHQLTTLRLDSNQISDLAPLSDLTLLEELRLSSNQIDDLTPLSTLHQLNSLWLDSNQASQLNPLAGLTNLEWLSLINNEISDLTHLSGLHQLIYLDLMVNQISDLRPLSGLENLTHLNLGINLVEDWSPVYHVEGVYGY